MISTKKIFSNFLYIFTIFLVTTIDSFALENNIDFDKIIYYIDTPNKISLNNKGETITKLSLVVKSQNKDLTDYIKNIEWNVISSSDNTQKPGIYIDSNGYLHSIDNVLSKSEYFTISCEFEIYEKVFNTKTDIYIEKPKPKPITEIESNNEQWERILGEIINGKSIILKEDIDGNNNIPTNILKALKKHNKSIEFYLCNGFYCLIDGKNIGKIPNNVIYIPMKIHEYKDKYISNLTNNNDISVFDLDTTLGKYTKFRIKKDFNQNYIDKKLYLYRLTNNKLELIDTQKSDAKSDVTFIVNTSGTYTISSEKLSDNIKSDNISNSQIISSSNSGTSSILTSSSVEQQSNTTSYNTSYSKSEIKNVTSNTQNNNLLIVSFVVIVVLSLIIIILLIKINQKNDI